MRADGRQVRTEPRPGINYPPLAVHARVAIAKIVAIPQENAAVPHLRPSLDSGVWHLRAGGGAGYATSLHPSLGVGNVTRSRSSPDLVMRTLRLSFGDCISSTTQPRLPSEAIRTTVAAPHRKPYIVS